MEDSSGVLPRLAGRPILVRIRASLGSHLAATSIPRRVILLDRAVLVQTGDFERILVHEIFHFAWVRMSNATRRSWETVLVAEFEVGHAGELGWSAEWRKSRLTDADRTARSAKWRRYVCESFCDSAAWMFSGVVAHEEFTAGMRARRARRRWFLRTFPATSNLPV